MKILTKLLTIITVIVMCTTWISCEENGTIKGYDRDMLDIETYAHDTAVEGGFSFTAEESWSTVVNYDAVVRSGDSWITLDPPSGNAGQVTINIILDENETGEDRSATISIICGETTLTIEVVQRGTDNPGDDDSSDDNGNDTPTQKIDEYAISRIIQEIDESGMNKTYTYTFTRKSDDPRGSISSVLIEGLPREDGAATVYDRSVEFILEYDDTHLYITSYADGTKYETVEATHNGLYVDCLTYTRNVEMISSSGSSDTEPIKGIEEETYYFYRQPYHDYLFRTEYVSRMIFEGHEEHNRTSETIYNMEWERVEHPNGIFNNPNNMTQISWVIDEWGENYEYITYNNEVDLSHLMGHKRPVEAPGSFIDVNQLIMTFWLEGAYMSHGSCSGILSLVGWITAPSNNLISSISYTYGEYHGSECLVEYKLNELGLIGTITASNNDASTQYTIEYTVF